MGCEAAVGGADHLPAGGRDRDAEPHVGGECHRVSLHGLEDEGEDERPGEGAVGRGAPYSREAGASGVHGD
jgi:hypothetical protein